jgi:nitronate monooxygenase
VDDFVRKGGSLSETEGRKCVCNGLMGTIGLGQVLSEQDTERALVTAGNDVAQIARFLKPGHDSYTAADVIQYLTQN